MALRLQERLHLSTISRGKKTKKCLYNLEVILKLFLRKTYGAAVTEIRIGLCQGSPNFKNKNLGLLTIKNSWHVRKNEE